MSSQVRQNFHQDCEAAINRQINLELYASYVYLSMVSLTRGLDDPDWTRDWDWTMQTAPMLESLLAWHLNVPAFLNKKVTSRYWTDEQPARIINYRVPIHLMHVFEQWWCGFQVFVLIKGWSSVWVEQRDGADVPCAPGTRVPYLQSWPAVLFHSLIISVVVYCCIVPRNRVSKHTYFLLLVLLLWPGWPGIAQLCQVFPPPVTWGAWACREANENAEPERREDLPARCQGRNVKCVLVFLTQAASVSCHPSDCSYLGRCIQMARYGGRVCRATYLLGTRQHCPVTFELNVKLQSPS